MPSNNSSLNVIRAVVMSDVLHELLCGVEVSATRITPWFHVLTEKLTNSDEIFDALKINAEKDVNENCKN